MEGCYLCLKLWIVGYGMGFWGRCLGWVVLEWGLWTRLGWNRDWGNEFLRWINGVGLRWRIRIRVGSVRKGFWKVNVFWHLKFVRWVWVSENILMIDLLSFWWSVSYVWSSFFLLIICFRLSTDCNDLFALSLAFISLFLYQWKKSRSTLLLIF